MSDRQAARARRIAAGGASAVKQLRTMISRMVDRFAVARQIFYGDDGKLTPASAEWLDDLAGRNFVNGGGFDPDPHRHAYNAGRRDCALDIIESVGLDTARLAKLRLMLKEGTGT